MTAGGDDIGVHLAGFETGVAQGTVFQNINDSGVWNAQVGPDLSVGVLAYVDLNNNNTLDPGEPSQTPSLQGDYQISGLRMVDSKGNVAANHVRLVTGINGLSNTMTQTFRAKTADLSYSLLGGTVSGADFGALRRRYVQRLRQRWPCRSRLDRPVHGRRLRSVPQPFRPA
jgi:hypothetical protein